MDLWHCMLAFTGCGFIGLALATRWVLIACERLVERELDCTPHIYEEPDPE